MSSIFCTARQLLGVALRVISVAVLYGVFGVGAAEVLALLGLVGLALVVLLARNGHRVPMFDFIPWLGDSGESVHADAHVHDVGYFRRPWRGRPLASIPQKSHAPTKKD